MKSYSGKRQVQEFYSTKRRLAIPGVHTYFVGDKDGRPLLCVNEQLSANLANAMPDIVTAIRQVLGKRKFTVIFDRGGFDHKLFMWLDSQHIGFITYQRGEPGLADGAFSHRETRFEGRRVRFDMAETSLGERTRALAANRSPRQRRAPDADHHEPRARCSPPGLFHARPVAAGEPVQVHGSSLRTRPADQLRYRPSRSRGAHTQPRDHTSRASDRPTCADKQRNSRRLSATPSSRRTAAAASGD